MPVIRFLNLVCLLKIVTTTSVLITVGTTGSLYGYWFSKILTKNFAGFDDRKTKIVRRIPVMYLFRLFSDNYLF